MVRGRVLRSFLVLLSLSSVLACYRPFSPEQVRREIVRQTGAEPETSFEFKLGGATMRLAKTVASRATGEPVTFGGLTRIDLAVFEAPAGKELDFSRIRVWGWDKVVQGREGGHNLLILVRTNGKTLGDLVLVAQGEREVVYGRLKGRLDPRLPAALEGVLKSGGLRGLRDRLLDAGGVTRPGAGEQNPPGGPSDQRGRP
jgi:hypothetical protein